MPLREPAVAGTFYPKSKPALEKTISELFLGQNQPRDSQIIISPHAGYIYSGKTAAIAHSALRDAKTYIILSPNHTGYGEKISIYPDGEWETPLGKISVDSEFAAKIAKYLKIERDEIAHISEHSIEVQLPFLQFTKKNFKILPITLAEHSIEQLHHLANAIFETGKSENYAIIASSDFSHYLPFEAAKTRDLAAIKHIENLNFEAFHREVEQKRLSICGFSAITASIMVSKLLMLDHAKLLSYDTSGTASKDYSSVVGYAALAVY